MRDAASPDQAAIRAALASDTAYRWQVEARINAKREAGCTLRALLELQAGAMLCAGIIVAFAVVFNLIPN